MSLKNLGMKNAIVKPPKNRKKPPMDTHLHVGFWKISVKAARNFYKVDFFGPEDAIEFKSSSFFLTFHLPLVGL